MLIIADARLPEAARTALQRYGKLLMLATHNITYPSISGHPDIFICQIPGGYVVAPNLPADVMTAIAKTACKIIPGKQPIAKAYPGSARYNAFTNDTYLIHHLGHSSIATQLACKNLVPIHVNQSYTRCNLVEAGGLYMTSDTGIQRVLEKHGLETMYINPRQIVLPGEAYGFFGGCTGKMEDTLLLLGSLDAFAEGRHLENELTKRNIRIVELYDGPLFDGGSILAI